MSPTDLALLSAKPEVRARIEKEARARQTSANPTGKQTPFGSNDPKTPRTDAIVAKTYELELAIAQINDRRCKPPLPERGAFDAFLRLAFLRTADRKASVACLNQRAVFQDKLRFDCFGRDDREVVIKNHVILARMGQRNIHSTLCHALAVV
jgi:hypothetical protein